jgi:hypothetical protein
VKANHEDCISWLLTFESDDAPQQKHQAVLDAMAPKAKIPDK